MLLIVVRVGHYDKCVALIREKNKDMAAVTESIFSHSQVQKKNLLVIALIVSAPLQHVY
jgi:acetyl-CoA carboxylase/biotin carboxylase 1